MSSLDSEDTKKAKKPGQRWLCQAIKQREPPSLLPAQPQACTLILHIALQRLYKERSACPTFAHLFQYFYLKHPGALACRHTATNTCYILGDPEGAQRDMWNAKRLDASAQLFLGLPNLEGAALHSDKVTLDPARGSRNSSCFADSSFADGWLAFAEALQSTAVGSSFPAFPPNSLSLMLCNDGCLPGLEGFCQAKAWTFWPSASMQRRP